MIGSRALSVSRLIIGRFLIQTVRSAEQNAPQVVDHNTPTLFYHTSLAVYSAGKPPKVSHTKPTSSSSSTSSSSPTTRHGGAQLRSARVLMRKRFGQHLLKNPDVVESIVAAAGIQPHETVFEIGPGTGNMTVHLLKQAKTVYAAELDPRLYSLLLTRVASMGTVVVVEEKEEGKVEKEGTTHQKKYEDKELTTTSSNQKGKPKNKKKRQPEQHSMPILVPPPHNNTPSEGAATYLSRLQVVRDDFLAVPLPPFDVLVANIPYQISSPVLRRLFTHTPLPSRAVIMFQLEFAQRMVAGPGSSSYCRLSVNTNLLCESVYIAMKIDRSQFRPPPAVDSAVIYMVPRGWPIDLNFQQWDGYLRLAFASKNKTLRSLLLGSKNALVKLTLLRQAKNETKKNNSEGATHKDGIEEKEEKSSGSTGITTDHPDDDEDEVEKEELEEEDDHDSKEGLPSPEGDILRMKEDEKEKNSASVDIDVGTATSTSSNSIITTAAGSAPRSQVEQTRAELESILNDTNALKMRPNAMTLEDFRRVFDELTVRGFRFLTQAQEESEAARGTVDAEAWLARAKATAAAAAAAQEHNGHPSSENQEEEMEGKKKKKEASVKHPLYTDIVVGLGPHPPLTPKKILEAGHKNRLSTTTSSDLTPPRVKAPAMNIQNIRRMLKKTKQMTVVDAAKQVSEDTNG